ncbi:MAG: hypothetical protein K2M06_09235 [Muribaculaceae bacterium]|nr:hypothetical protein [Muribaculaceae bacterium]
MNYDLQIGNTIRRGISYAELITFPIEPETFIRRENGEWIYAKHCIELTHILAYSNDTYSSTTSENQDEQAYYNEGCEADDFEREECIGENSEDNDSVQYELNNPGPQTYYQISIPSDGPESYYNDNEAERIFIPTAEYLKCKQKRKTAIIGVCTLGLAGLFLMGVGNTWRSNIFAGTSLSAYAGMGFVLKCMSFCFLTTLIAVPYFIYSVLALIYNSIKLNNLKR